jgi:putative selenium metabolism protein SsnA
MMGELIIGNGLLFTLGQENRAIAGGGLYSVDGLIKEVDETNRLRAEHPKVAFLDAEEGVIMPGMICSHTHFYGAFALGWAFPGPTPTNFMETLERLWWRLDKLLTMPDVEYSALIMLTDAIRNGVTTLVDHHASPYALEGSLDVIANAARRAGVRTCLAYETTDRDGPEIAKAGLEENSRFISKIQSEDEKDGMFSGSFGLHASFTVPDSLLEMAVAEAHSRGVGVHIHVAEDRADRLDSERRYGLGVVERLQKEGALSPRTLAAHCIHLKPNEAALLAESGTMVAHNTRSNMNNAVGTADVEGLIKHGTLVGLGNDGFSMNMLQELKFAYLMPKAYRENPQAMPIGTALNLLFKNNAEIVARLFAPFMPPDEKLVLGELTPGARADVVVLDYKPRTPMSEMNFGGHAIFGMEGSHVRHTVANGRILMRNRELVTLDETEIAARSRELAAALWQRA